LALACLLAACLPAAALESVTDFAGRKAGLKAPLTRVVSLVPEVTDSIYALGAGSVVVGNTIFFNTPAGYDPPALVGGFYAPSLEAILKLKPQVVITGRFHQKLEKELIAKGVIPLRLQARRLGDLYLCLDILGRALGKQEQAKKLQAKVRGQMKFIAAKAASLPAGARRRVTRIMGVAPEGGFLFVPGDDSFQNELIAAAGGLPPRTGKQGGSVKLTLDQWRALDPQAAYYCGHGKAVRRFLGQPGWREVEAVRQGRLFGLPCDLTCRTSVYSGDFVAWLSALVYGDYFSQKKYQLHPWAVISRRPLKLGLDYVAKAEVVTERIQDFSHKTLLIELKEPQMVLSTLEGQRGGVVTVGNHYLPPPSWRLGKHGGLPQLRRLVLGVLGLSQAKASLLFTGANMDNLAVKRSSAGGMTAYALVTAGARHNALRIAVEGKAATGPGTINILVLTNRRLSPRAMARALVTVTEAKTAALEDLDLRSSYQPLKYAATGTGTDNILVVRGEGPAEDLTGGHSPMGALMARAVYAGVLEALLKQNRLRPGRNVFQRLRERKVSLYAVAGYKNGACPLGGVSLRRFEGALLNPRYAALVEAALAFSDAQARGQFKDSALFAAWCDQVARQIAGKRPLAPPYKLGGPPLPPPLAMALGAILRGLASQPQPLIPISGAECGS
jgi:ABC-type Fe3+-hydroxamate transport system substrate-binding protein/adenosylcobinamide amidohydrolase